MVDVSNCDETGTSRKTPLCQDFVLEGVKAAARLSCELENETAFLMEEINMLAVNLSCTLKRMSFVGTGSVS